MTTHSIPPTFELQRDERVRPGLLRVAAAWAEVLRTQVERPEAEHEAAVHTARLALKRLRAMLRLLRPSLDAAIASRESERLRRAAAQLAPSRDAAVALNTLTDLAARAGRRAPGDAQCVASVRSALASAMHDPARSGAGVSRALLDAADAARTSVEALSVTPWRQKGWRLLAAGVHASHLRARRRLRRARRARSALADDDTFHAWRAAVKSLLYQLQLVRAAVPPPRRALLDGLDRLQEQLGREHDLEMLAAAIEQHRLQLGPPEAVRLVLRLAERRRRALRKAAIERGEQLLGVPSTKFVARLHRRWLRWRRRFRRPATARSS